MNLKYLSYIALFMTAVLSMTSCVGDDFVQDEVDPVLAITNAPDTIAVSTSFLLQTQYLDNVGRTKQVDLKWSSDNESSITVNDMGLITAVASGSANITATTTQDDITLSSTKQISVGEETVTSLQSFEGEIRTTSSYVLKGDFVYQEVDDGVMIDIADNYVTSDALPGLFIYLSNNKNSIKDAFEIGAVTVFEGAHKYDIADVGFADYKYIVYFCKPFNVKVGDANLSE